MSDCKPCSTPVDTCAKVSADVGPSVDDPTAYRSLVGALQYLTFTRPDIAYAIQQVCLHMHDPREVHLVAAKRILRYLQGTIGHGLVIPRSAPTQLVVYTDADWAGCPDTRRSTSGYAVFLGGSLVPGRLSANPPFLGQAPRPSTVPLPTVSLKPPGCGNFYRSFTILWILPVEAT